MMVDTEEMILPTPGSAFEWRPAAGGPVLVCRELERYAAHLFTTAHWALGARTTSGDDHNAWDQVAHAYWKQVFQPLAAGMAKQS